VLGSPACSWWRQWRWRHGRRSGRKLSERRKIETRKKVDFFVNFAPPMHGTHPYLHEHFIFIGDKSWLLIQPRRISTIGSNWSSWTVKFWQLKAAWVALLGQCHGRCSVNQLEWTIPGYSQMSGHHNGVCFVKFGEGKKH